MKQGFSVIEMVIIIMISSMIMMNLLQIYNSVKRHYMKVEQYTKDDDRLLVLQTILERDFSSLSCIWFDQTKKESKQLVSGVTMPAPEKIKRNKFFFSVNKDEHLDLLTFVTTSGTTMFGQPERRFVRVVYRLQHDEKNEGTYRLLRKELPFVQADIDEDHLQGGMFYEVVDNVHHIGMKYYVLDKKVLTEHIKNKKEKKGNFQEVQSAIRSVAQWGVDVDDPKTQGTGGEKVPRFVEMKIGFKDPVQGVKEYTVYFPVTVDLATDVKLPKPLQPKKEASGQEKQKDKTVIPRQAPATQQVAVQGAK